MKISEFAEHPRAIIVDTFKTDFKERRVFTINNFVFITAYHLNFRYLSSCKLQFQLEVSHARRIK